MYLCCCWVATGRLSHERVHIIVLVTLFSQVFKPYMDASLARQFLRLKRSGVKVPTWLASHLDLLSLLVPERDLHRVYQANGAWDLVADSIKNLMDSSLVGKTVFSFCSALVNAAHYKSLLEGMLEEIKATNFDEQKILDYKIKAKEAADSFKAMGFIQPCWSLSSSCFPRVHASPEFMLPQSSCKSLCFPRVHASREFMQSPWVLSRRPPAQAMNPLSKRTISISFVGTELKMEVRGPHVEWELRRSW